jgi:GTP pyrophosphokinase
MDSKGAPDGSAVVDFVIETVDVRHLNRLVERLRRVPGVREVHRVQKI